MGDFELTRRVYQVFDPEPLTSPEQQALYVDLDSARGGSARRHLETRIRLSRRPTCQVLAGHRGSGKSTELVRLRRDLESVGAAPRVFTVVCRADDHLDRNDVDFPDVLLAVVRQVARDLRERAEIELQPGYFRDRWKRLKDVFGAEVELDRIDLETGIGTISTSLKSSPEARRRIREALEPEAGTWTEAANDVLDQAALALKGKGWGGLAVLVDDLDKMVQRAHGTAGCLTSEYLFVHRAAQLTSFRCHVVYSIPIELAYSHHGAAIRSIYGGQLPVIPMVKIAHRPPFRTPWEPGRELLRDIVRTRLEKAGASELDVFADSSARDEIVDLSGGQPTELMTLMSQAIVTGGLPIGRDAIARLRAEGRREYARLLRTEHLPLLKQVHDKGDVDRSENNERLVSQLLDSRTILQYVNGEDWYDVNPLAAGLVPAGG